MEFSVTDINNWTGIKNSLIQLDNPNYMKWLADTMVDRVVEIGHTIISSNKTSLVAYKEEENSFEIYEQVENGLFKHCATIEFTDIEDKYLFIREDVIVQGYQKDEEGNIEEADIVGIKIDIVEHTDYDSFEYNEDDYYDVEEEVIDSDFYRCNECARIRKSEENKYLSF